MKVCIEKSPIFQRRLKPSEESDYSKTLRMGKSLVSNSNGAQGKSLLIVSASSLPQNIENNTGVGNFASEEASQFFDFAKKYWGINEIQFLPLGQYHTYNGGTPIYNGTSMNLGSQIINIKDYLSSEEFQKIVNKNNLNDTVNFSNVIESDSVFEQQLKSLYNNMPSELNIEFQNHKKNLPEIIERKSIFAVLKELYKTADYNNWSNIDKNLFNEDYVSIDDRNKRISELKEKYYETIDFYKFKNFLAEQSFQKAKNNIHSKGMKINGDLICGFSYDEVWSHPKAFLKDSRLKTWMVHVLDVNSPEAEKLLREKVRLYSKWYDGFRVDASWTYVSPSVVNTLYGNTLKLDNGTKFLDIIDDEVKKVKGSDYNLSNIMHEFAAASDDYEIFDYDGELKEAVKNRTKVYTSDYLSDELRSVNSFINRGENTDSFLLGVTNHDSNAIKPNDTQIKALSKILKIPENFLKNDTEFIKAKFAEPLRVKNNFIFFLHSLGINKSFQQYKDNKLNWTLKIPINYEDIYFDSIKKGYGYNPMDALEKQFIAQGLDKTEPKLYKKIIKYKNILVAKEGHSTLTKAIAIMSAITFVFIISSYIFYKNKNINYKNKN